MKNNTNAISLNFNYDNLREAIRNANDKDFYNSIERVVKKASIVVAKSTIIEEVGLGVYYDSLGNPARIFENKEMLETEYEAAIQAAFKALIWLNSQVRALSGHYMMQFRLENNTEAVTEACFCFLNGITG